MNAKNALGRGLDALLSAPGPEPRRVLEVEIHRLQPNPRQPRARFEADTLEDLAQSIRSNGILQPILVRPADGKYEIIAGERRWRAAQRAGLQRVPVLVREVADAQMLELALVENLQREDLNPVEEARAYQGPDGGPRTSARRRWRGAWARSGPRWPTRCASCTSPSWR